MDNKEKQIALIKGSGLTQTKVAELTGINYKKMYRVIHEDAELKYSECKKLELLNDAIAKIKEQCAEF